MFIVKELLKRKAKIPSPENVNLVPGWFAICLDTTTQVNMLR